MDKVRSVGIVRPRTKGHGVCFCLMDDVQNCDRDINVPSPRTCGCYFLISVRVLRAACIIRMSPIICTQQTVLFFFTCTAVLFYGLYIVVL
jgi:hypothetical protein